MGTNWQIGLFEEYTVHDRSNICKALKRLAVEADVDGSKDSPRNMKRQLEKDVYNISYNMNR